MTPEAAIHARCDDNMWRDIEAKLTPMLKRYFSRDQMKKYEPLWTAAQQVLDSKGKDTEAWNEFKDEYSKYANFDVFSTWDGKRYDVVFYGVSGYTGYLMMEYLKRTSFPKNKEEFTIAFAGRTARRVKDMRDREFAGTPWEDTPVLAASFDDVNSVIDLVKSAKVIINVAGPYMKTAGEVLIDACLKIGADYMDISGEIPWSLRVLELDEAARQAGRFIIPSAASAGGFPDLGVYLSAKYMKENFGEELRKAICYTCGGGSAQTASAGTLKTRAAMATASDEVRIKIADPFSLGGFVPDVDRWGIKNVQIEQGTGKCTPVVRKEDMDTNMSKITHDEYLDVWRGPFVYSYFDTRIVRRSNALLADLGNRPYGRRLNFMEYQMLPPFIVEELKAGGMEALKGKATSAEGEKEALKAQGKYYENTGEGPPLEDLMDAWVGYFSWAQSEGGHEIKHTMLGRDGYYETARVSIEMALTLVFDREKLPFQGGVLTPAVAGGTYLIQRLIDSGMYFKMGEWVPYEECKPVPF